MKQSPDRAGFRGREGNADVSDIVKRLNVSGLEMVGTDRDCDIVDLIHYIFENTSIQIMLLSTRLSLLRKLEKEIRSGALNYFYLVNYEIKSKEEALKVANLIMNKIVEQDPKAKSMVIVYDFDDISEKDNIKKIIVNQWKNVIPLYNIEFLIIDSSLNPG